MGPRGHTEGRGFHGWRIVLAGFVIQMLGSGFANYSAGAFLVVLQAEFGWTRALISGAYAAAMAQAALLAPVQGRLVGLFGSRAVVRTGVTCLGAGLACLGEIRSPLTLYLVVLLIGLGYTLSFDVALQSSVVQWFRRRRSTAMGLMASGTGAGGALVPLIAFGMTELGWQTTARIGGILMTTVGLAAAQVLRPAPERGEAPLEDLPQGEPPPDPVPAVSFEASEALRTRAFWLLAGGQALCMFGVTAVGMHLVPYAVEQFHFSLTAAGGLMTVLTACGVAGNVVGGLLGDRMEKRAGMVVLTGVQAGALALLTFGQTLWALLPFAVVQGFTVGARIPLGLSIRADYFGPKAYSAVWGASLLGANVGSMAGMVTTGYLADLCGTYRVGFGLLMAATASATLLFAAARPPQYPRPAAPHPALA